MGIVKAVPDRRLGKPIESLDRQLHREAQRPSFGHRERRHVRPLLAEPRASATAGGNQPGPSLVKNNDKCNTNAVNLCNFGFYLNSVHDF